MRLKGFEGVNLLAQHESIGRDVGALVDEKNAAYGDSFRRSGRLMRELYPDGIGPDQMDDALAIVRVIDKLFRIATNKDAFGEDPWRDIAGYAILSVARNEEKNESRNRDDLARLDLAGPEE